MQRVDKVSEPLQWDAVVVAVELLQRLVNFQNIGKSISALKT